MSPRTVAITLFVLVLAGCAGLTADTAVPTGADATEGYAELTAVSGTVEYRFDSDGSTTNTTVRVERVPGESKVRQRVVAPPARAGQLTVSNGSVSWLYNDTTNTATRITLPKRANGSTLSSNRELVETVFGNLSEARENRTVAVSPLPMVPTSGAVPSAPASVDIGVATRTNASYLGTETVAGRRAHGVTLRPVGEDRDGIGGHLRRATYWFDAEYFYPLRTETVIGVDGDVTRMTRAYQSVTFNAEVEPGTFTFDPPADATVETPAEPRTFDTVAGAAEQVEFDAPEPHPPAGFDLETARVAAVEGRTTLALRYANGSHTFSVSKRRPPLEGVSDGESVDLGATTATRSGFGDLTMFRWSCRGSGYTVSGDLPAERLRRLAEAVAGAC
jgi:outer membrane lipoprotein-sorting protein